MTTENQLKRTDVDKALLGHEWPARRCSQGRARWAVTRVRHHRLADFDACFGTAGGGGDAEVVSGGPEGLFFGGGLTLLGKQTLTIPVVGVFAFVVSFVIAKVIDSTWDSGIDLSVDVTVAA